MYRVSLFILTLLLSAQAVRADYSEQEVDLALEEAVSEIEELAEEPLTEDEEQKLKGTALEANIGVIKSLSRSNSVRLGMQFKLISGEYRTRTFILSTDALLRVSFRMTQQVYQMTERKFQIAPVDLAFKKTRLGFGFSGVEVGSNFDHALVGLIQFGFYASVAAVLRDDVRLSLRTGYERDSFRVNLGDRQVRHYFPQSVRLTFQRKYFDGFLHATYLVDAQSPGDARKNTLRTGLGIGPSWDFKSHGAFRASLMARADFISEPWMEEEYGIPSKIFEVGGVFQFWFDPMGIVRRERDPRKSSKR